MINHKLHVCIRSCIIIIIASLEAQYVPPSPAYSHPLLDIEGVNVA